MKLFQAIKKNWHLVLLLGLVLFFFNKTIIFGKIPFPGDLLVGQYEPYRSYSYFGIQPGGFPHLAQGPDVIKEILPWKKFAVTSYKKLQIPFWNPYNFSGNPILANFQSGVFYPINLLFLFLNFESAWSIYIISAPFFGALFTFLFLRRLNLSRIASLFGGIVFAFSSYSTVWVEYGNIGHTFIWLPLILYLTDKFIGKKSDGIFAAIVIVLSLSILAGYIQGVFYIFVVSFTYYFLKSANKGFKFSNLSLYLLSLLLPIGLTAFQLLPTLELFNYSTRGNYSLTQIQQMLNPLYYMITVFVPDFFGNPATRNYWFNGTYIERVSYFGIIPLIFAFISILFLRKKIEIKIFSFLFIGCLLISTDLLITRFLYLVPIPILSTTVATRILSIAAFSGSVLAAFGLENLLDGKNRKNLLFLSVTLLAFLIFIFVGILISPSIINDRFLVANLSVSLRNLILPIINISLLGVGVLIFSKKNRQHFLICTILFITFFDLYYYFAKITPFAQKELMYPATPVVTFLKQTGNIDRVWGYGSGYIESNFHTFHEIYSTEGNDPLHIREYTQLVSVSKDGRVPEILPRPDANIAGGFGKDDLANNPYRQKILNILGVKFITHKDESLVGKFSPDNTTFPENTYKLVWQSTPWQVYENKKVVPRILITDKYKVVNFDKALKVLLNSDFNEKEEIVLNKDPKIKQDNLISSYNIVTYRPNRVEIKTKSNKKALLYLSDNYYPGWGAKVDNVDTEIYRANYAFRAIVIPEGNHIIVFEYKPKLFYYGLGLSVFSVVLLGFITLKLRIKNEK